MDNLRNILEQTVAFEKDAHSILAKYETSISRVIVLEKTYQELTGLTLKQDQLFRQSLRCVENELFRAAHVMAWSGCIDYLEERLTSDGFRKLRNARPKWNIKTAIDLREKQTEYSIIEACRDISLFDKSEMKALHGLLNKRNECAHPSDYFPNLNETLGYISELITRIGMFQKRKI